MDDALTKAKSLVDDDSGMSSGKDAEYWLADEDTEMITANMSVANAEISRAGSELSKQQLELTKQKSE